MELTAFARLNFHHVSSVLQVPGGKAHIHVCGSPARDCTEGAEESKSGEACLMLDGKFPKAYQRKNIIYDGQEVRILYDEEEFVLLLYCGKEDKSDRPQYIGKVRFILTYSILPAIELVYTVYWISLKENFVAFLP